MQVVNKDLNRHTAGYVPDPSSVVQSLPDYLHAPDALRHGQVQVRRNGLDVVPVDPPIFPE
jgi:hypothetical protein